jgi:hypothetical protein
MIFKEPFKLELKQHPGNTLSEYAIIIGLTGLASIGALNLLGGSISKEYQSLNQGNAHAALDNLSSLNFQQGSSSKVPSSGKGAAANNPTNNYSFQLINTSNSGSNATSMDGTKALALNTSYNAAIKLFDMADKITDPGLKAWYLEAANRAFSLTSSQMAYEWTKDPTVIPEKSLSRVIDLSKKETLNTTDSIKSIAQWQGELETHLATLDSYKTANPAEVQMARDLISGVLNSNTAQYNSAIVNTDLSQAKVYYPDVNQLRAEANKLLDSGAISNNTAIQTSLESGIVLDEAATK